MMRQHAVRASLDVNASLVDRESPPASGRIRFDHDPNMVA